MHIATIHIPHEDFDFMRFASACAAAGIDRYERFPTGPRMAIVVKAEKPEQFTVLVEEWGGPYEITLHEAE